MANFNVGGFRAVAATQSPLNMTIGSSRRFWIKDIRVSASNSSAPTDVGSEVDMLRTSTAGTGTSQTPSPSDPVDAASSTTALANISAEPTTGVILMRCQFNPRVTYRWTAWDPAARKVSSATASNGIGLQGTTVGGANGNFMVDIDFEE